MERVNLGYSAKNIPIAQDGQYLKTLIEKTESFLRRLRWKAFFFLNPKSGEAKETYGFTSKRSPPPIMELCDFEGKMLQLIKNIKFKKNQCDFQKRLLQDVKNIRRDDNYK